MSAHVLYGDSFLVSAELKKLEAEAGAGDLMEANQHRINGSQAKLPELLATLNAMPFLDVRRLVVVEGLLAVMEGRGTRRGRTRSGSSGGAESGSPLGEWQRLAPALPQMPDTTLLFLVDGAVSDTNPLLRALQPVAMVRKLVAPGGEVLARWIKTAAQEKGASISPAAINSLADLVGGDLWVLDRELEKLSLYTYGRNIEEEDVRELVSQVREANVFNMVDALIEGRAAVALPLLQQLREDGREAPYLISMVERQLRLLALARDLLEQRVPQGEMGSRLGVNSQFVVRKTLDQARRHSRENIAWCYRRLLETDLAIKRGRLEPDLALELLVADLANPGRG